MAKLLSQEEVRIIANAMAEEYGLTASVASSSYFIGSWSAKIEVYRSVKVPRFEHPWLKDLKFTKIISEKVQDLHGHNYEDALTKLEQELNKFNPRVKIAEHYREKYMMQEATEALDEVLREKSSR